MSVTDPAPVPPIRTLTRLLAEMQTSINAAGLRLLDGDIDRFGIFTLIMRQAFLATDQRKPISMHSLAISLSRPFETVRRHVGALVEIGLCERVAGGIAPPPTIGDDPRIAAMLALSNDCFVRFVEDLAAHDLIPPLTVAAKPYDAAVGVQCAVDVMLGTAEANRASHHDWLSLVIFSTVACANTCRFARRPGPPVPPGDRPRLDGRHAIRASRVAQALGLPESTIRRRVSALTVQDGPLVRIREGLIVSQDWLDRPDSVAASDASATNVRRVLARAAAHGFPLDAIATAYVTTRPDLPDFG